MLGQNDASLRPDLRAFERFDTCERRPRRKTLDQQAKSGDPDVKRHATWGMSDQGSYETQSAAVAAIAPKIGCIPETLRVWVRQAEKDSGARDGATSAERGGRGILDQLLSFSD